MTENQGAYNAFWFIKSWAIGVCAESQRLCCALFCTDLPGCYFVGLFTAFCPGLFLYFFVTVHNDFCVCLR